MQKNVVLAIILSVAILVIYNRFLTPKQVPVVEDRPVVTYQGDFETRETRVAPDFIEAPLVSRGRPITLENPDIRLIVNTEGGRITSWYIKDKKVDLLEDETKNIYFYLDLPEDITFDLAGTDFKIVEKRADKMLILEWENTDKDIKLTQTVQLPEQGYHVLFNLSIDSPDRIKQYFVFPARLEKRTNQEERLVFWANNLYREKKEGVRPEYDQRVQWMGLRGKDFITTVIPLNQVENGFFRTNHWGFSTTKQESSWLIYAGPKTYAYMRLANNLVKDALGEDYRLISALDISLWGQLSVALQKLLIFLFSITHNYGVAIILLTLIIFGILSPLTLKQFESMQKMQLVQPELKEVQKKFKGEPKKMQAEIMKIYAKHKVNPIAGCLPMVIQLPIIFILYRALLDFPFAENPSFLWIPNLGDPNIPLLLGLAGSMFLQQKTSQKMQMTGDQAGIAKMMQFFPLFLIVILWSLPSGVMLYWFTSTSISIAQQFIVQRKTLPVKS